MKNEATTVSVAKIIEDMLLPGRPDSIQSFSKPLSIRFPVRKSIIDEVVYWMKDIQGFRRFFDAGNAAIIV